MPDHSQSYPAWSGGEQSNMCFEVPMKRDLMALVRAQEEALDFERLQLRWQLRLTSGLRSAGMHRSLFPCVVLTQWCAMSEYSRRAVLPSGRERSRTRALFWLTLSIQGGGSGVSSKATYLSYIMAPSLFFSRDLCQGLQVVRLKGDHKGIR